jgi:hypothetical protein
MERKLQELRERRTRELLAAHTSCDRQLVLRRLLAVERINDDIKRLEAAVTALDEPTIPILVSEEHTAPVWIALPRG